MRKWSMPGWAILVLAAMAGTSAVADSITFGGETFTDVYIAEGGSFYYVSFPEDGHVLNVAKSEVDPKDVVISEDPAHRQELYAQWREKTDQWREKFTSEPAKESKPAAVEEQKVASKLDTEGSATKKEASSRGPHPLEPVVIDQQGSAYTQYDSAWIDQQRFEYEAKITAKRRAREKAKYRALTQRRVITSEDSPGPRITGSYSGGYGGGRGYGGGYGGYGGYGGRR